ncbi:MAG: hypothetical protein H6981_14710 [Gammaproteobacteria bacterium]|nr:hypothetical protein [Gammaproteobacteria bacterium]MCP5138035.1 hypothetical protein [Gammaproteobacteria bacterium]
MTYSAIGTLGSREYPYTCSQHALNELHITDHAEVFDSFDKAAQAVLDGVLPYFLVPAAYPDIAKFIQNDALTTVAMYIYPIPRLVFGSTGDIHDGNEYVCYFHPATRSLLPQIRERYPRSHFEFVEVGSNVEACIRHCESPSQSVVVTNELCADAFRVGVVIVLNNRVSMPWVMFGRSSETH